MAEKIPEIRSVLAKNLKEQRKKTGYSQEKLAEISGLSVQTINDIEGGRRWVSDKSITRLSTALSMECYQLLMPEFVNQNRKDAILIRQMLELMKNLKKNINTQVEDQFMDFLKSNLNK